MAVAVYVCELCRTKLCRTNCCKSVNGCKNTNRPFKTSRKVFTFYPFQFSHGVSIAACYVDALS